MSRRDEADALTLAIAREVVAEFNELFGGARDRDCAFVRELRQCGFGDVEIARVCRAWTAHFEIAEVDCGESVR